MVRLLVAGCLATLPATALLAGNPQQGPFQLSCSTLPFETIKKDRDIDDVCDRAGTAGTDPQRETEPGHKSVLRRWPRGFGN